MNNENHTSQFKGIWLPSELIFSDLSLYAERLLSVIWALDVKDSMGCKAGNAYLAKMMKMPSKKHSGISNLIKKLIDGGHVHRTLIYKRGSLQVESRHLKVTSPLLITEKRREEDLFLAKLSFEMNTPVIQDDDPPSSEMTTPIIQDDNPIIQNERDSIVNNRLDSNKKNSNSRGNKNLDSDFSEPIDTGSLPVNESEPIDVATLIFSFKDLSLSNNTFHQKWKAKYSDEEIEKMADEAAATYVKNFLRNARDEAAALNTLDAKLKKSKGMEPATYLHSWILKEPSFKTRKDNATRNFPNKKRSPEFSDYQERAEASSEMARQYAERQSSRN